MLVHISKHYYGCSTAVCEIANTRTKTCARCGGLLLPTSFMKILFNFMKKEWVADVVLAAGLVVARNLISLSPPVAAAGIAAC